MFVVDTNILLYAVNPDSPDHRLALELIEDWRRGDRSWFLTWGIVYEFLRVSTHRSIFPNPLKLGVAREWLGLILAAPTCGILVETDRHWELLGELARDHVRLGGTVVHDFHIAAVMKEHGVTEIRTADTDFHQFEFLQVRNPLTEG